MDRETHTQICRLSDESRIDELRAIVMFIFEYAPPWPFFVGDEGAALSLKEICERTEDAVPERVKGTWGQRLKAALGIKTDREDVQRQWIAKERQHLPSFAGNNSQLTEQQLTLIYKGIGTDPDAFRATIVDTFPAQIHGLHFFQPDGKPRSNKDIYRAIRFYPREKAQVAKYVIGALGVAALGGILYYVGAGAIAAGASSAVSWASNAYGKAAEVTNRALDEADRFHYRKQRATRAADQVKDVLKLGARTSANNPEMYKADTWNVKRDPVKTTTPPFPGLVRAGDWWIRSENDPVMIHKHNEASTLWVDPELDVDFEKLLNSYVTYPIFKKYRQGRKEVVGIPNFPDVIVAVRREGNDVRVDINHETFTLEWFIQMIGDWNVVNVNWRPWDDIHDALSIPWVVKGLNAATGVYKPYKPEPGTNPTENTVWVTNSVDGFPGMTPNMFLYKGTSVWIPLICEYVRNAQQWTRIIDGFYVATITPDEEHWKNVTKLVTKYIAPHIRRYHYREGKQRYPDTDMELDSDPTSTHLRDALRGMLGKDSPALVIIVYRTPSNPKDNYPFVQILIENQEMPVNWGGDDEEMWKDVGMWMEK
jgi:hypothetical protein